MQTRFVLISAGVTGLHLQALAGEELDRVLHAVAALEVDRVSCKLHLAHHDASKLAQRVALTRVELGPRLVVDDAQAAEVEAVGGAQRRARVEADVRRVGDERIAGEAPVLERIEHDERLVVVLQNRMRAERAVARHGDALQPLGREAARRGARLRPEVLRLLAHEADNHELGVEDELHEVRHAFEVDVARDLWRAVPPQCLATLKVVGRHDGGQVAELAVEALYTLAHGEICVDGWIARRWLRDDVLILRALPLGVRRCAGAIA